MTKETAMESKTSTRKERKGGVDRRTLLKSLGVAGSVAVAAKAGLAQAGNAWTQPPNIPDNKLVELYTNMLRARWWEEAIKDAFIAGKDGLYGACHLYIGEEAVACGTIGTLNNDDYIASTHRGHGHLIAKGGDLDKMSAEMFMRETGYNFGYGGSMHLTDVSRGILGMNGIIGPSYLLSAGAAYGIKVRGTKQVAMAFGGDGSVQNGWFWAAQRNARLYDLPLISVIENNGYQISMPTERTIALKDLAQIGAGLEIPFEIVDGNDVLAVYAVAQRAVDRARNGGGPTIIEAKCNRWYDHSGMAGAKVGVQGAFGLAYRSDREVRASMANDPIGKYRSFLIASNVLTEAAADKIVDDVKGKVAASLEFARNSPKTKGERGVFNVFAQGSVTPSQFA
jgi:acetoin:2,6-dichlorophenolindophenol oxidoreductase subunit alpha